jgi:hypothetical protein
MSREHEGCNSLIMIFRASMPFPRSFINGEQCKKEFGSEWLSLIVQPYLPLRQKTSS